MQLAPFPPTEEELEELDRFAEGLHVVTASEVWLQVSDRYVITEVPNRLLGATLNADGEAI